MIGDCEEELTESGELKDFGIASYKTNNVSVSGSGTGLLIELIKVLNNQISSLHEDVCNAIPPSFSLRNITPLTCVDDVSENVNTEEFLSADSSFNYLLSQFQGQEESPPLPNTRYLRNNMYQYLAYMTNLIYEQQVNNFQLVCDSSPNDVVAIVGNDRFINKTKGRKLILHFVTLNNYPKRNANSSYRPIQIPAAKDLYDWETDFEELRWVQGNQYAELRFEGRYAHVSGWFQNEEAANSFFDEIVSLTNAKEDNRVIPLHSNPKTNILVRPSRPYRAFICELTPTGQNQCLAKYQPVIKDDV